MRKRELMIHCSCSFLQTLKMNMQLLIVGIILCILISRDFLFFMFEMSSPFLYMKKLKVRLISHYVHHCYLPFLYVRNVFTFFRYVKNVKNVTSFFNMSKMSKMVIFKFFNIYKKDPTIILIPLLF